VGISFRQSHDASRRALTPDYDNIWDAITIRADLNSDLDAGPKATPINKDGRVGASLRVAVTNLSHIALHETAFDVFAGPGP